jgi:hypothetical protein
MKKKKIFLHPLKVIEERSRIRIHQSEIQIRGSGSGSAPKCHESPTLLYCMVHVLCCHGICKRSSCVSNIHCKCKTKENAE